MKPALKILLCTVALLALVGASLSVFLSFLDLTPYKPALVEAIRAKTGRTVRLDGTLGLSLTYRGGELVGRNLSLVPSPSSGQEERAQIDLLRIRLALLPLLSHHFVVDRLTLEGADLLLVMPPKENSDANPSAEPNLQSIPAPFMGLALSDIEIRDSRIAVRGPDGILHHLLVDSLVFSSQRHGRAGALQGSLDGVPLRLALHTDSPLFPLPETLGFDLDLAYGPFRVTGNGSFSGSEKTLHLPSVALIASPSPSSEKASPSVVRGALDLSWKTGTPVLTGSLTCSRLNPLDYAGALASFAPSPAPSDPPVRRQETMRLFSDTPLSFASLQNAEAELDLRVDSLSLGQGALTNLTAHLSLESGTLFLPVSARIGGAPLDVTLKLVVDQNPAAVTLSAHTGAMDLSAAQKLFGESLFLNGTLSFQMDLAGSGATPHALASSLSGVVTLAAEKGEILAGAAGEISSALAALLNPLGANAALNCFAARFIVKKGVMISNGILLDSAPSTVAGQGFINLGEESVDLALHARTKGINIGGLIPPLQIRGPLRFPSYQMDASGAIQKALGALAHGGFDDQTGAVPALASGSVGQNACLYTLEHPQGKSKGGVVSPDLMGRVQQNVNGILGGLLGKNR